MLRLVLALFLAGVSAKLSPKEIAEYGERLLNECTQCNIMTGILGITDLMDEIREITPEFAEYLSKYDRDCTPLCTSQVEACDALHVLSKELFGPIYDFFEGKDVMTPLVGVLKKFVDPVDSCGIQDPTMQIARSKRTRGQKLFLEAVTVCAACRIGMKLIHHTIVGGKSDTSKAIIAAAGKGMKNLCIKIKIPELMSKISFLLGKIDVASHLYMSASATNICAVMPKITEKIFAKFIAPIFTTPMAGAICGKISPGCSFI